MVHFRVLLSVPASRVEAVSLGQVGDILQEGLTRYQQCQEEGQGFLLQPASLSVTGETREEWEEGIEGKDYQKKTIKRKGEVFMDICWTNQV